MVFGRQPAFWIGLVVTLIMGAVNTLTGEGLISQALNGQINDGINAVAQLLLVLAPLITGLLIRPAVTPNNFPAVKQGTVVTVITPEGQPNTQTVLR
jgi:ABC-type dipeptide/oligopeptide/nickel transport system permease subunit